MWKRYAVVVVGPGGDAVSVYSRHFFHYRAVLMWSIMTARSERARRNGGRSLRHFEVRKGFVDVEQEHPPHPLHVDG